jgi:hypothetical protein
MPGPMRDVYLDFRLPWPTKIATGMLIPGIWWQFEIYLTTTWTASYFDNKYIGFPSIKSNGFFTKTKEALIKIILQHRRTVHASKSKITHTRLKVGKKTKKKSSNEFAAAG